MITVKQDDIGLYRDLFSGYRTLYTDRCADRTARAGRALYAFLDGEPAGYLLISDEHGGDFISYVFTVPDKRGMGVMQTLIRYAADTAEKMIGTAFSDAREFAPALMHVMEKLGFEQCGSKYMFRCDGDDLWDRWDAFMEKKGRKSCETLRRQGYSTVTLADASEELLEQYRQTPYNDYGNQLNHQHLILPGAEITKDVSVMCTLNGRLAAYVFAYMPDRYSAIFKTLSSSAALQGGAAILLPLCESFAKVRGRGCTQFVFSMDGVGGHANSFRNKVLSNVISKTSKRLSYIYHKKEAAI